MRFLCTHTHADAHTRSEQPRPIGPRCSARPLLLLQLGENHRLFPRQLLLVKLARLERHDHEQRLAWRAWRRAGAVSGAATGRANPQPPTEERDSPRARARAPRDARQGACAWGSHGVRGRTGLLRLHVLLLGLTLDLRDDAHKSIANLPQHRAQGVGGSVRDARQFRVSFSWAAGRPARHQATADAPAPPRNRRRRAGSPSTSASPPSPLSSSAWQ